MITSKNTVLIFISAITQLVTFKIVLTVSSKKASTQGTTRVETEHRGSGSMHASSREIYQPAKKRNTDNVRNVQLYYNNDSSHDSNSPFITTTTMTTMMMVMMMTTTIASMIGKASNQQ